MMLLSDKSALEEALSQSSHGDWREEAYTRFSMQGLPGKRHELYRYADTNEILERSYERIMHEKFCTTGGKKVCIENGALIEVPESDGISVEVNIGNVNYDAAHFDPLYHLGHALSEWVIRIEVDASYSGRVLEIVHRLDAEGTLIPYRIDLCILPEAKVELVERFEHVRFEKSLLLYGFNISVANHATLNFYRMQTNIPEGAVMGSHFVRLHEMSHAYWHLFDRDAQHVLHLYEFYLRGEEAKLQFDSVLFAKEEEVMGNILQIHHDAPHGTSNQSARQILGGRARGVFDGKVIVSEQGRYTVANQLSKALLLSHNAGIKMATKPQLEIYIDELEASHGASIGHLNEEQMFYLLSRGIDKKSATNMMSEAFMREIFERIENERIRNDLLQAYGIGEGIGENLPI